MKVEEHKIQVGHEVNSLTFTTYIYIFEAALNAVKSMMMQLSQWQSKKKKNQ